MHKTYDSIIPVDKSTDGGIVITALEIVHPDFGIVVVAAVAVGVEVTYERRICVRCSVGVEGSANAPCVVGDCLTVVRGKQVIKL